uniref:Ionotropic glutamate receptor C-terminal domain-containing protein n=1 Tax=Anopheles farauti TaxID=69004 RepID=A0A182QA11_9DIPT
MLNRHPCYKKSAIFIILMGGASFERKEIATEYLELYSILNYILVPVASMNRSTRVFTLYTWNQYTKEELYFRSTDRPVQRFFPDKLRNLNGYRFMVFANPFYPYIVYDHDEKAHGVLVYLVTTFILQPRNGTAYYSFNDKERLAMDADFVTPEERSSYANILYFHEMTGICLICPVRTVRDFLGHLLKPFSLGIWFILGGLFVFCRMLQILFPNLYRYDLIGLTFFGGGGIEYEQPFAFRIVTLTLAVLVFFLSEAYNTKIISLMSLAKFYEQPRTLKEIADSDYRILATRMGAKLFPDLSNNFLSQRETVREERRLGESVLSHYCTIMLLENAWVTMKMRTLDDDTPLYIVDELLIYDKSTMQLARHSPFFELFERLFIVLRESGIWNYLINRLNELAGRNPKELSNFQECWDEGIV